MTSRSWEPVDPAVAFFPVELRPLLMPSGAPGSAHVVLDRHFAVVDVDRTRPFAVVTDDYELITNRQVRISAHRDRPFRHRDRRIRERDRPFR
jgi:hypothetical protein